jgi:LysM repeat protein
MVVVHNYSNEQKSSFPDSSSENIEIDDDRAYAVGLWAIGVIVVLLLMVFVAFAIARSKNNEQTAQKSVANQKEQILGAKETTKTSETPVKTEVKTESSANASDIQNLERPLTDDEIQAKAKTMPGSQIHEVAAGESLYTIGEKYNIDWREIAKASNLAPPYSLRVGQKLIIPKGG